MEINENPNLAKPSNETVEKVSLQQMTGAKWEETIENCPVLVLPSMILVIFKPEVGDFCIVFSGKGFFDSFNGVCYRRLGRSVDSV